MELSQLKYFCALAKLEHMTRAAESLHITQPALSRAISSLEKELGITLFNRGGKGVTLTNDGTEFLQYARHLVGQYDLLLEKYGKNGTLRKKFGISTQHYSFAVKSFVEMVKKYDTDEYEFAIRETKTADVIEDVTTGKSEVGILYLSDFNRKAIGKFLKSSQLEFHPLIKCEPYVYLWKGHPLAGKKSIRLEELRDYPCLSFEQGPSGAFYFSEEILSTYDYIRTIKATDRATMLNLMVGLNGYTLCSGIICEELNGPDYVAIAFKAKKEELAAGRMEIGYIVKQNTILSNLAESYIRELRHYLTLDNDDSVENAEN